MTTLTIKKPIKNMGGLVFEDGLSLGMKLFELYKEKILEHYHISSYAIIDEDEDVKYYEDDKGVGIHFKHPVSPDLILEQLRAYHG